MSPTDALIKSIRERLEKATAPPPMIQDFKEPMGPYMIQLAIKAQAEELIASAPTDLALLCDILEESMKALYQAIELATSLEQTTNEGTEKHGWALEYGEAFRTTKERIEGMVKK